MSLLESLAERGGTEPAQKGKFFSGGTGKRGTAESSFGSLSIPRNESRERQQRIKKNLNVRESRAGKLGKGAGSGDLKR